MFIGQAASVFIKLFSSGRRLFSKGRVNQKNSVKLRATERIEVANKF
jgi:hypothetical protein